MFQKFHTIGEMFASLYAGEVEPGDVIECGHCDWSGPTTDWPPHLLTCTNDILAWERLTGMSEYVGSGGELKPWRRRLRWFVARLPRRRPQPSSGMCDDELSAWLRARIGQVEREQAAAWDERGAGFNVENEDILGRFFDDVKARLA